VLLSGLLQIPMRQKDGTVRACLVRVNEFKVAGSLFYIFCITGTPGASQLH
jgi:hypothetical protein